MSSSAITTQVAQLKIGNVQNQADNSAVYSGGIWSLKNSTALTSVTIDNSGNVGIGTASPAQKLAVVGTTRIARPADTTQYLELYSSGGEGFIDAVNSAAGTNQPIIFRSGNNSSTTERMRIDASGNLLVGKTAVDLTTTGMSFATASGVRVVNSSTSGSVDAFEAYSSGAGAYRFYVAFNGVISATSTTINAISDRRLKENIRDLDEGLSAVLALKPRKFDWKEGKGADIKDARGFIAQEFERVFPDLISEWKDPAPEGEEPYKSVRPDLIPVLVKAIQELSAKVDAQAAEIEALKAK